MNKGFFFESKNELPNTSVSGKEDSFVSINFQSILLRVLNRVAKPCFWVMFDMVKHEPKAGFCDFLRKLCH